MEANYLIPKLIEYDSIDILDLIKEYVNKYNSNNLRHQISFDLYSDFNFIFMDKLYSICLYTFNFLDNTEVLELKSQIINTVKHKNYVFKTKNNKLLVNKNYFYKLKIIREAIHDKFRKSYRINVIFPHSIFYSS